MGYIIDLNECAASVMEVGSMFFNFDPNDGECVARYTRDASCPEGLNENHDYYNWYQIVGAETEIVESETESESEENFETNIVLIREGYLCLSES
jgi:hypothetical protein